MGTWDYIGQYPNMYAAAIPMSGNGDVGLAPNMTQTLIWNFHAVNDDVVGVAGSQEMVAAVRAAGGNVIYTEYANGGHGIWTPAYNTPILMDWVYAQKRGVASTVPPLLSIKVPTDGPIYAASRLALDLGGTASDGGPGPTSVSWSKSVIVRPPRLVPGGVAAGTTNWTITNAALLNFGTNLILVTGKGTSWYSSLGGNTSFNSTLAVIFPPFISLQPESRAVNKGDAVTFTVAVNLAAPLPQYQWRLNGTNIAGATAVFLALTNVQVSDAGSYSVVVTNTYGAVTSSNAMLVVNQAPIADASATQPVIISANGTNATVILDGTRSSDPDGDLLQYFWFEAGSTSALATGVVGVVALPIGKHPMSLVVSDGLATDTNAVTVSVLTTSQAVQRLIAQVTSKWPRSQPLMATLAAALASLERNNPVPAINQLLAFQTKVRAQVAPLDPALAMTLIQSGQEIIDVLSGGNTNPGGRPQGRFTAVKHQSNGRVQMHFAAERGPVYLLEASTNLVDWEKIGVGVDQGDGIFTFEDANAAKFQNRFYRAVRP